MITLCSKIIDGKFQLYFRNILKEHFEKNALVSPHDFQVEIYLIIS